MLTTANILIAGAGWRVTTFVIPALIANGVSPKQITILRRKIVTGDGIVSKIRTVTKFEDLAESYNLIINCVTRNALVSLQAKLCEEFPDAVHFCDTPVFSRYSELPTVMRLAKRPNLYSLEDWTNLPNLAPIIDFCRQHPEGYRLNVDNIGIPIHFLAGARVAAHAAGISGQRIVRKLKSGISVRHVGSTSTAIQRAPKDFSIAQISVEAEQRTIVDRMENLTQEALSEVKPDTIVRHIDGNMVKYYVGTRKYLELAIPEEIINAFTGQEPRRNAHELDKCVALINIFSDALSSGTNAYRYSKSVRDTAVIRFMLRKIGISFYI